MGGDASRLGPRTESRPLPWAASVSPALHAALPATDQAAWERLLRCPHTPGSCAYPRRVAVARRDSEVTTFSGCEPLNSRDPCSRREAATSKRVRPWARGEGCASQLCSRSSELCCEPSGVPWKPFLSEDRGRGTTLGSRTGVGGQAGSALREVGMVSGANHRPLRQDVGALPTHPRQGQGHWRVHLVLGAKVPRSPLISPCLLPWFMLKPEEAICLTKPSLGISADSIPKSES